LFLVAVAAKENIAAVDRWHDLAGYAIVALVFAGTMWIASKLTNQNFSGKQESRTLITHRVTKSDEHSAINTSYFGIRISILTFALLFWLIGVEVAAEGWYRIHERDSIAQPGWTIDWPKNAEDFHD